ncbi:MAG: hypothetical protein JRJ43_01425 [Deltaproteobacteria bacterium]|nr:hypothetical protein [Deltaproteobacteria bacterium]MBW1718212.1 hypothetical protein [Deltaproteobacteria bacterium]
MVRSLDVQQIILQSNVVERVHQVQQQHPNLQQRYFADQLNKEESSLKEKVKDLEESERLMIKEEERQPKREKNPKGSKQERGKEDASDISNDLSTDEVGGKVDIKV